MNEGTARPLIKAIQEGDIMQAQGIVLAGVDVNSAVDEDGKTALHLSSMQGLSGLSRMLIEQSADIDAEAGPMLYTPLHLAALQNREVVITLLLENNASVNVLSAQGDTPLALSSAYGTLEAVQRLIAASADPDVPGEPLGPSQRVLYTDDLSVCSPSLSSASASHTVECVSKPGCSALMRAVQSDADFQVVKAIAEVRADLSVADAQQNQLTHLAVQFGNLRVVRMLLDFRANVNALNTSQRSPLHTAAERGTKKIIKLLVDRRASVNAEDNRGVSALQLSSDGLIEQQLYLLGARRGRAQVHTTAGSTPLQAGVAYRPEGETFRIHAASSAASPLRVLPDPGGPSSGSSWQGTPLAQRRVQSLSSIGLGSSPAASPPASPGKHAFRRKPRVGDSSSLLLVPTRDFGAPQIPSPSRSRLPEVGRTPPLSPLGSGPSSPEPPQPLRPRSRLAGDSIEAARLRPLGVGGSQAVLPPTPTRQTRSMRDFAAHMAAPAPFFSGDDSALQGISPISSPKGGDSGAILT